jgi:hypothetical protein
MAKLRPLRLQERDLRLLTDLGEVLLLDSRAVHERYYHGEPSGKSMLRRLGLLREHGIIEPIPLSVAVADRRKLRTLYRLTQAGAQMLEDLTGIPPVRVPRVDLPKPITLHHRAGVARMVLTVNDACVLHELPKPEWILEQDTVPGSSPAAPPTERFVLYEAFTTNPQSTLACRPDASCRLRVPDLRADAESSWHDLLVYWELDRSTETHAQFGRKMPGYRALLDHQAYRRHWPQLTAHEAIRIFVVCLTAERMENLRASLRHHPAAEFLRFTTVADMQPAALLTDPIWRAVDGSARAILATPQRQG